MRRRVIQRILGLLLTLFSLTLLPPALISAVTDDGAQRAFAQAFGFTLALGLLMWWPVRKKRYELRLRDGFHDRRLVLGRTRCHRRDTVCGLPRPEHVDFRRDL